MEPRTQPQVRRVQQVILVILLLTLPPTIACMSMQTRRQIRDEAITDHPDLTTILTAVHQLDGRDEQIAQQLQEIREQLAALQGKCQ